MKGVDTGLADWSRIREVVEAVDVPVVANGNIQMPGDVERCLATTGAAAVMSAEGILYNPWLFADRNEESWIVAKEYLEYARRYQAGTSAIRAHIFRICHHSLLEHSDLRMRVSTEHGLDDYESIVEELRIRTRAVADTEDAQRQLNSARNLFERIRKGEVMMDPIEVSRAPYWICKPYFRLSEAARETIVADGEKTYKEKRQARKRERRKLNGQRTFISKRVSVTLNSLEGHVLAHAFIHTSIIFMHRRGFLHAHVVLSQLGKGVRTRSAKNVVDGLVSKNFGIVKYFAAHRLKYSQQLHDSVSVEEHKVQEAAET
ncbi:hypothetical protein OESDEN_16795 [Oesophagostomum dentatum]|uniref:DUS-like FMN-binding domain-containing protein n=1 Tax=Oesophagostomum dentatum TaxID=61180 RepID=A0A0B1SHY5_OESDE|nr:hypothetical protein OESDEN_16795 [Oesophagostomum dentatum]